MIALTSISPKHNAGDVQLHAVNSWIDAGLKVISLNSKAEVELLAPQYPNVEFVTVKTGENLYKRSYAFISSFIDIAEERGYESILIINSDIQIRGNVETYFKECTGGLIIANRYDHNGDFQNGVRYDFGFDAFFIHSRFFKTLPKTLFVMGQTWWDYWLPYRFIVNKFPIFRVQEPIFFHQRHPIQYDVKEWERMTRHFQFVENYRDCTAKQCTGEIYQLINKRAGRI